jgi:hypothetical protein
MQFWRAHTNHPHITWKTRGADVSFPLFARYILMWYSVLVLFVSITDPNHCDGKRMKSSTSECLSVSVQNFQEMKWAENYFWYRSSLYWEINSTNVLQTPQLGLNFLRRATNLYKFANINTKVKLFLIVRPQCSANSKISRLYRLNPYQISIR